MSIESSRRIMKIAGILTIGGAILAIVAGVLMAVTGGLGTQAPEIQTDTDVQTGVMVLLGGGVAEIIAGVISLIEGSCSYSAGKSLKHVKAAWFFALLGLAGSILRIVSFFLNPTGETKTIISIVLALVLNILIFIAAGNLKRAKA